LSRAEKSLKKSKFSRRILQAAGLLAACALIGFGLFVGEPSRLFMSAANICLACMGIG